MAYQILKFLIVIEESNVAQDSHEWWALSAAMYIHVLLPMTSTSQ